ncbi:MAG: hypothetical protein JWP27_2594 [Flaviaesturariibacter sp.]|nr:hypothetical protein [Flaviaesturariibacter sp.]
MKKAIFAMAVAAISFTACKKDKDDSSLQHRWSVVNTHFKDVFNGATTFEDNYNGVSADYVDFRGDNRVYTYIDGTYDTANYQMLADNKVMIDTETFDIQSLTSSNATLYQKTSTSATTYSEVSLNLKR